MINNALSYARVVCIRDPVLISILVSANILVWLAYVTISLTAAWIIFRAKRVPFPALAWLTASFILSCSGTHFCAALVFFRPAYYLEAAVCAITAVVSAVTAIILFREQWLIIGALRDWAKLEAQIEQSDGANDADFADRLKS